MKRYLAIDYGLARVGIAKNDILGVSAHGIETIKWNGKNNEPVINRIVELSKELGVEEFVIGLPQRTDNKPSEAAEGVKEFARQLQAKIDLPVNFHDERFTTVIATRYLQAGTSNKKTYRSKVDQVAAEIILQSFMDKLRFEKNKENF